MAINRRQFVVLSTAVLARCATGRAASAPATAPASTIIDAGDINQYQAAGCYDAFAIPYDDHSPDKFKAFFIVHRDGVLYALSALCTHKACVIDKLDDGSFKCPCHDSEFSPTGKVQHGGKAKRDLPRLAVKRDANGHLLVDVTRPLANSP